MAVGMSKENINLLCVAHPDDETIFFAGLLLAAHKELSRSIDQVRRNEAKASQIKSSQASRGKERGTGRGLRSSASAISNRWKVICFTTDGSQKRKRQFTKACALLGVEEVLWWEYQDIYSKRLPLEAMISRLQALATPKVVFTHGIVGEYGHPHHQDVSLAVHEAFDERARVYSSAYNCYPDFSVHLTKNEFEKKAKILTRIYGSETTRFLNVLPATSTEGFCKLDLSEVRAVYEYLARGKKLEISSLKKYLWLKTYLPHLRDLPRPF
jgi:LmbE family N-acetylglucosaminyl deacetylase